MKYIKHHHTYVFLLAIFLLGIVLLFQLNYNKQLQAVVVAAMSVWYVIVGILHHATHHDLTSKIVVEYILIGSLGMVIVLFFIKGGIF